MIEKVQIAKLYPDAILPKRGSRDAAGCDLYAHIECGWITIKPHDVRKISAGVAIAIPSGYAGLIYARSGIATKNGLRPANCVGVVDADYRGEVIVALRNDSDEPQQVHDGDRIAQLVITPYVVPEFELMDELPKTERGANGFGSTGH